LATKLNVMYVTDCNTHRKRVGD